MFHPLRFGSSIRGLALTLVVAAGCTPQRVGRFFASDDAPVLDHQQHVDVQLALGRTFERQQQWDGARQIYSEILRQNPEQAEAAHRLAIVYDHRGDAESSARWFEQARQLEPDNADILCDFGYYHYRQGDLAAAETRLREALSADAQHRRARNHLGLVLARTDRRGEALAEFRQAGCTTTEARANLAFASESDPQQPKLAAAGPEQEIRSR